MKKLKGIISFILSISVIFLMVPFNIYADTLIVPTYSSYSVQSEWQSKLTVTNYCDGSNTQASCKLTFTLNDDYYGFVMFNAYNNNTQIYTNQYIYIAGGIGEYNYLFYQNGVKPITNIEITYVELFLRGTNIDLSEVVQLLTLINSSNQAIYSNSVTIRNNLISVLEEEIEQSGYLETLTKLRNWNFPVESLSFVYQCQELGNEIVDLYTLSNWIYPVFNIKTNNTIGRTTIYRSDVNTTARYAQYIMWVNSNLISNLTRLNQYFSPGNQCEFYDFKTLQNTTQSFLISFKIRVLSSAPNNTYATQLKYIGTDDIKIIPIYQGRESVEDKNISTDFALVYGMTNSFLDNIQIIANGTSQSQSAASNLESGNNQMAQDMNSLATIESGYNQQFNNSLQTIDFTNPVQSNQGMLPAANFVISVFNSLISNNPFSVLIIVVCILLIGKKVIGK